MSTYMTLDRAWRKPFKVKSTFARDGAFYVALCASENFITTNIAEDTWGDRWAITEVGMEAKRELIMLLNNLLKQAPSRQAIALIDGDLYLYERVQQLKKRSTGVTTSGH